MAADLSQLALGRRAGRAALTALRRTGIALVPLLLLACTPPSTGFDRAAASLGLDRAILRGTLFRHVIYSHDGARTGTLHVYIDGDGTPWIAGHPAADPTPRNPLIFRLMVRDPKPAVYLGRPCYLGTTSDRGCAPRLWTGERYSPAVVESMEAVVRRIMAQGGYDGIAWFGHSGGGALAVLLAARFAETRAVTTVAGVLDSGAWAKEIAHEDLSGSLNPAEQPPLSPKIRQFHYAGANDRVVPPEIMAPAARRIGGSLSVVDGFDHVCCWEQVWSAILDGAAEDELLRYQAYVRPRAPP